MKSDTKWTGHGFSWEAALPTVFTAAVVALLLLAGCTPKAEFETRGDSTPPSSRIDWLGKVTPLKGDSGLKLNSPLPEITLINSRMNAEILAPGKVRLISVLPSLDTEVCDIQTHMLNDDKTLSAEVERITVSKDLPYAQNRFAENGGISKIKFFSDYRNGDFGRKLGLEIERNGLLARALIVVDQAGVVRYFQIVPAIYALPELSKAVAVANQLSGKKS